MTLQCPAWSTVVVGLSNKRTILLTRDLPTSRRRSSAHTPWSLPRSSCAPSLQAACLACSPMRNGTDARSYLSMLQMTHATSSLLTTVATQQFQFQLSGSSRLTFLRLPFQAIEVYLAHVNPAEQEIQTDIASEILFHKNISIQLLGMADDGLPMVQAYYYDGDYINIFTQEIIDTCMTNIPTASESPCQETTENVAAPVESTWAEEVEEEEAKTTEASEVAPNSADVVVPAPQYYPADYYCHNSGTYYQQGQPTIAYMYQDQNGMNQIYYVAGPYMVPQDPAYTATQVNTLLSPDSGISSPCLEVSSQEETSSSDESTENTTESKDSHNFINKPFEDWTQEDYAIYYGQKLQEQKQDRFLYNINYIFLSQTVKQTVDSTVSKDSSVDCSF